MRSAYTERTVFKEQRPQGKTIAMHALGYLFRCVLVLLCSYGCVRTVFDSVGAELPRGTLFTACTVFCALFCLLSLSVKTAAAGCAVTLIGAFFTLHFKGGAVKTVLAMVGATVNAWYRRLDGLGYRVPPADERFADMLNEIGSTEEEMYLWGAVFASLVICAAVTGMSARRIRLIPLLLSMLSVCMYFVLYGANKDSTGPALAAVAVAGMSAMFYYENLFANKRAVREALGGDEKSPALKRETAYTVRIHSELGGFFGMSAALLMAVLITVPALTAGPMRDIPAVSGMIDRASEVVNAAADGNFLGTDGLTYIGNGALNQRDTRLSHRKIGGAPVLSVSADLNIPVYLRGWTGVDYIEDKWKSASYSRMSEYRAIFGGGFSAELLTNELLTAVDPKLTELPNDAKYAPYEDFGYVIAPVHVMRLKKADGDMLLPSYTDPKTNLLGYGTGIRHTAGYLSYYEGIFTSRGLASDEPYTVVAQLPLTPTAETLMNVSLLVRHYGEQRETVSAIRALLSRGADEDEIRNEYLLLMAEKADTRQKTTLSGRYSFPEGSNTLAYRYVHSMSDTERSGVDALIDSMNSYNNYVYANYITVCENYEAFVELANRIIAESGTEAAYTYPGRHRVVESVINYLSANMTYTLTPAEPSSERTYYNSADTFLFDTNEGYCVQYATSAVMLLRCLGIPARYATGYIADTFEPSAANAPGVYTATVTEDQAHAWIEVYYDYYGWIQYEATAPFVTETTVIPPVGEGTDGEQKETDPAPDTSADEVTETDSEVTNTGDTVTEPEGISAGALAAIISAVTFSVLLLGFLIAKHRADRAHEKLTAALEAVRRGGVSPEEKSLTAGMLCDIIFKLLRIEGLTPDTAETPTRFFARADQKLSSVTGIDFAAVLAAVQAYEFGGAATDKQLFTLARCAETLYLYETEGKGKIKGVYIKYFVIAT